MFVSVCLFGVFFPSIQSRRLFFLRGEGCLVVPFFLSLLCGLFLLGYLLTQRTAQPLLRSALQEAFSRARYAIGRGPRGDAGAQHGRHITHCRGRHRLDATRTKHHPRRPAQMRSPSTGPHQSNSSSSLSCHCSISCCPLSSETSPVARVLKLFLALSQITRFNPPPLPPRSCFSPKAIG